MNCPYCDLQFKALAVNASFIPKIAPIVCEQCISVSLVVYGCIRKMSDEELKYIQESPVWAMFVEPIRAALIKSKGQPC